VVVVADEPKAGAYYGGKVAAPVVARIVDRSLRLLEVPPRLVETARMNETTPRGTD
jgi:cell division protein FtsI (penicillin-binding protein 3)